MSDEQRTTIGMMLGRIPSGIFVLTATDGAGAETGMLCSWVQQVSFEPPMASFVVQRDRYLNDWLATTKTAVLNMMGESEKHLLVHFGRGFKREEPAFEGIALQRTGTGLPVLEESLGYLEGNIVQQIPTGDHVVYILEVTAAGLGETIHEEQPMVHIRKSGFHY